MVDELITEYVLNLLII